MNEGTVPSRDWTPTDQGLPPEGAEVETMDSGGHVQTLIRVGGLWFVPDQSMYVYYTPKFWRSEGPSR